MKKKRDYLFNIAILELVDSQYEYDHDVEDTNLDGRKFVNGLINSQGEIIYNHDYATFFISLNTTRLFAE